jgi:hypothetical protein
MEDYEHNLDVDVDEEDTDDVCEQLLVQNTGSLP